MKKKKKNLSKIDLDARIDFSEKQIGIVVSEWNGEVTAKLHKGCLESLAQNGILPKNIASHSVPGSFELPLGAKWLLTHRKVDAIICIGCVIKGETKHDEFINHAVSKAIMTIGVSSGKPVIFGVLTPSNMDQALERAGGKHGNKGVEAAVSALKMIQLEEELKKTEKSIGFG